MEPPQRSVQKTTQIICEKLTADSVAHSSQKSPKNNTQWCFHFKSGAFNVSPRRNVEGREELEARPPNGRTRHTAPWGRCGPPRGAQMAATHPLRAPSEPRGVSLRFSEPVHDAVRWATIRREVAVRPAACGPEHGIGDWPCGMFDFCAVKLVRAGSGGTSIRHGTSCMEHSAMHAQPKRVAQTGKRHSENRSVSRRR
jgi:hypothetical protein